MGSTNDPIESAFRQVIIDNIESITGALRSIPYHKVSTGDLVKIFNAVMPDRCAIAKSKEIIAI